MLGFFRFYSFQSFKSVIKFIFRNILNPHNHSFYYSQAFLTILLKYKLSPFLSTSAKMPTKCNCP